MAIITKLCEWCGKEFQARVFPSRPIERSRFCSRECLGNWTGQQQSITATKTRVCPICGQAYKTTQHHGGRKYCSPECVHKAQSIRQRSRPTTKVTLTCAYCGRKFQRFRCRLKDGKRHFCSRKCRGAYQTSQGVVKQTCAVCGEPYTVSKAQIKLRGSKYCSRECQAQVQVAKMQGAKNPNWRGGRPQVKDYGPHWGAIKRRIRKRDNYTCQHCGIKRKGLDVHHKIPLRLFLGPEFANHSNNLITFCRSCHLKADYALDY